MSLGLRVEDRLDGHTNYKKKRMQSIFEEAEVWDIMVHTTQNPVIVPINATQFAAYNKKNNKGLCGMYHDIRDFCLLKDTLHSLLPNVVICMPIQPILHPQFQ